MNDANVTYQSSRLEHTTRKFRSLDLPDLKNKRYLDLGCNAGAFCELALEEGASTVVGVDIDPRLIDVAREAIPKAEFFVSRFEDIDLGAHKFDVITIASAIHYSREFLVVVAKIFNHLAPDGLLVIEGGLFDPTASTMLNTPIPNWRKVGDHCRHLSMRFVSDVLFPDCRVRLIGPSLQQGGDNLSRYAMHVARNGAETSLDKRPASIDLEAFVRALAVSYDTVQPQYGISHHMEQFKRAALLGPGTFDATLKSSPEILEIIVSEIQYCVSDWASEVILRDCFRTSIGADIVEALNDKGMKASLEH